MKRRDLFPLIAATALVPVLAIAAPKKDEEPKRLAPPCPNSTPDKCRFMNTGSVTTLAGGFETMDAFGNVAKPAAVNTTTKTWTCIVCGFTWSQSFKAP